MTQAGLYTMVTPIHWPDHIPWWHSQPGLSIYYGDTHTQARLYTMVTPIPWPDHIPWWHQHPSQSIYYGDTHTPAWPYTMVTPTLRPDHILWWHPHPGQTIFHGDTHTQARPYTMVTPIPRPNHILWWHPHPGRTIFYGNTSIPGLDHISRQHPVVRPDPSWPINYGQLSTPAVHKSWYNAGTLCAETTGPMLCWQRWPPVCTLTRWLPCEKNSHPSVTQSPQMTLLSWFSAQYLCPTNLPSQPWQPLQRFLYKTFLWKSLCQLSLTAMTSARPNYPSNLQAGMMMLLTQWMCQRNSPDLATTARRKATKPKTAGQKEAERLDNNSRRSGSWKEREKKRPQLQMPQMENLMEFGLWMQPHQMAKMTGCERLMKKLPLSLLMLLEATQGKAWANHHTRCSEEEGDGDRTQAMSKDLKRAQIGSLWVLDWAHYILQDMCWTWGVHMATSCKSHVHNVAMVRHPETSYTETTKRTEGRQRT